MTTRIRIDSIATSSREPISNVIARGTVKINIPLSDFETCKKPNFNEKQLSSQSGAIAGTTSWSNALCQLAMLQKQQVQQQQALLTMLASDRTNHITVNPDAFDGGSSVDCCLKAFECVCEQNRWYKDCDNIRNMRACLSGNAKH